MPLTEPRSQAAAGLSSHAPGLAGFHAEPAGHAASPEENIPPAEEFEFEFESGGVFDESDELELAGQLLEIQDEAELDQFLGDLIRKAGRAVGKAVRSPTGQALGLHP